MRQTFLSKSAIHLYTTHSYRCVLARSVIFLLAKFDVVVKSRIFTSNVIPAKAGIQEDQVVTNALDPGFRWGDDFLRRHQV
jgi:hypothetical protein